MKASLEKASSRLSMVHLRPPAAAPLVLRAFQQSKTGYDSFSPATPAASDGQVFAPYEGGILAFSDS